MEREPKIKNKIENKKDVTGGDTIYEYLKSESENIRDLARIMISEAKEADRSVRAKFNEITITADKDSTVEDIVADYHNKIAVDADRYNKSPQGQREALEEEKKKKEMQQRHDSLIEQLSNLNFDKKSVVLNWLYKFQDPSDYSNIEKDPEKILKIFMEHGYQPYEYTDTSFNNKDRDESARHIISIALDNLRSVGSIHPVVRKSIDEWKKNFSTR